MPRLLFVVVRAFGVLIGIFVVCALVLHNHVNLDIGLKLALGQAVAYCVQWTSGSAIGDSYASIKIHWTYSDAKNTLE